MPALPNQAKPRQAISHTQRPSVCGQQCLHMFQIQHCIYFSCLMQGCAGLEEDARTPVHLCPMDLRKWARIVTGYGDKDDPKRAQLSARYNTLLRYLAEHAAVVKRPPQPAQCLHNHVPQVVPRVWLRR